jgi:restriction endonuclease S subunit
VQQQIIEKISKQQALIEGGDKILKNWQIEQELFNDGHLTLLRKVADIQRGKFSHRPRNDPKFYYGKYPFIQINDITENFKFIKSSTQSLNELGINVSKKFNSGTLVMSIASSIGEVGILTFDAYFPDSIVAIYPDESLVNKEYLFYYFKAFNNELIDQSSQAVQKNINIDKLENFKIKMPTIEKQINIVSKLNNELVLIEKLETMKTEAQAKIDNLINSIWESS